jgi:hypothetical protein
VDVPALAPAGLGFTPLALADTGFGVADFGADGF